MKPLIPVAISVLLISSLANASNGIPFESAKKQCGNRFFGYGRICEKPKEKPKSLLSGKTYKYENCSFDNLKPGNTPQPNDRLQVDDQALQRAMIMGSDKNPNLAPMSAAIQPAATQRPVILKSSVYYENVPRNNKTKTPPNDICEIKEEYKEIKTVEGYREFNKGSKVNGEEKLVYWGSWEYENTLDQVIGNIDSTELKAVRCLDNKIAKTRQCFYSRGNEKLADLPSFTNEQLKKLREGTPLAKILDAEPAKPTIPNKPIFKAPGAVD